MCCIIFDKQHGQDLSESTAGLVNSILIAIGEDFSFLDQLGKMTPVKVQCIQLHKALESILFLLWS